MPTYWIVVGSPENFHIAAKRKFDMFGFKSTRRRESSTMQPGDKLVFYLTGVKKFGGIASVQSDMFEDHKRVFESEKKPGEDYPFRVKTKPEIVLAEDQWLHVPDYVPLLEFTKKGHTKSWALAFQGNLHRISEADYKLIEKDMRARAKKRPATKQPAPPRKTAARASRSTGARSATATRRRTAKTTPRTRR